MWSLAGPARSITDRFIQFKSMHIVLQSNFFDVAATVKLTWSHLSSPNGQVHTVQDEKLQPFQSIAKA
jgi:hypothetical protein